MEAEFIDIAELAKTIPQKMQIGEGNTMTWDDWWTTVIGEDVPREPSLSHEKYKKDRLAIKNLINSEFAALKDSHRLIVENTKGVYLLNGVEAVREMLKRKFRQAFNAVTNRIQRFEELAECDVCPEDAKMLKRLAASSDDNYNALIGTVVRMRSLPVSTKQMLLAEMGCDT